MTESNSQLPKPRRSFIPFLIGLPLALGFIILILLILQYRQVRALVSPTKGEIQVVAQSSSSQEEVLNRVRDFLNGNTGADSVPADTMSLSETDVNHLMRLSPAIATNWDTYQLSIGDSSVKMINVMPAQQLTGPVAWMVKLFGKGGWLNSEMEGQIHFKENRLQIDLTRALMNGINAPVSNFNRDNRLNPHQMAADTTAFSQALLKLTNIKVENRTIKLIR
jgi:hypothetical protein